MNYLWTPEQAEAFQAVCLQAYEQIWLPLQVPAWTVWKVAVQQAAGDASRAATSWLTLAFLTLRPVVLLLYMMGKSVCMWIWKYVLVKGVSQQGVQYLTKFLRKAYKYQCSLTWEQVAMEGGVVVALVALYQIRKVLQKQAYFQRLAAWMRKQRNRVQATYRRSQKAVSKSYDRAVHRIAQTSLWAAVMTPHLVFLGTVVTTKVLFADVWVWLARETAVTTVLSSLYPVLATLFVLQDERLLQAAADQEKKTPRKSKRTTPTKLSSPRFFPRTTPRKRASSTRNGAASQMEDWKERELYWKQFWMVSAAWQVGIRLLYASPGTSMLLTKYPICQEIIEQVELAFYVWIYLLPYLVPNLQGAPEGRPLAVLAPRMGQAAVAVYRALSIVSEAWWNRWVVQWADMLFSFGVFARMISRETAASLREAVTHGQSFLIPVMTLLMPRFVSVYGQYFVQYCLPLYQQQIEKNKMLEYWICHCLVSNVLGWCAGILWWIPLSSVFIFAAYALLALSPWLSNRIISSILHDLEIFGIVTAVTTDSSKSVEDSWVAQGMQALLQRLPKAADETIAERPADETATAIANAKEGTGIEDPKDESKEKAAKTPRKIRVRKTADTTPPATEEREDARDGSSGTSYVEPDDAMGDCGGSDTSYVEPDDANIGKPKKKNTDKENSSNKTTLRRSRRNHKTAAT